MPKYRVIATDQRTGRDLRLELVAQTEVEASQIVSAFADVRRTELAPRDPPKENPAAASVPAWCPNCGYTLTAETSAPRTGPKTVMGQVSTVMTMSSMVANRPGGKKSYAQQIVAGLIIAMGLPVMIFGILLSKEGETEAGRSQTLLLTAGILVTVGLGWLVVALISSREKN